MFKFSLDSTSLLELGFRKQSGLSEYLAPKMNKIRATRILQNQVEGRISHLESTLPPEQLKASINKINLVKSQAEALRNFRSELKDDFQKSVQIEQLVRRAIPKP